MKFKLNTIENYKNNGWLLTKKRFQNALLEYSKTEPKFGTFGYHTKPETQIYEILFEVKNINIDTFEVEIELLNVPLLESMKDIIKPEILDLHVFSIGSINKQKKILKDYKIIYFSLVPKVLYEDNKFIS